MRRQTGLLLLGVLLGAGGAVAQEAKPAADVVIGGRGVRQWTEDLGSPDVLRRVRAVNALMRAGPEARAAAPALVGLFRHGEATFLSPLAGAALARIGADALPALRPALADEVEAVRGGAALALGLLGPAARPAVPALATLTTDDRSVRVRQTAARALGQIGGAARPAAAALRKALADPAAEVRVEAAFALWSVANDSAGVPVLAAVADSRAVALLGEIGPAAKGATTALRRALTAGVPADRVAAAEALYRVSGDAEAALPVLAAASAAPDVGDRRAAIAALGTLAGETKAVARLVGLLASREAVLRREAACSLCAAGTDGVASRAALLTGLNDSDAGVRWWCALALAASSAGPGDEEAVRRIFRAARFRLDEGDDPARLVLDVQMPGRAVPALTRLLAAGRSRLRLEAARALAGLGLDPRPATTELLRTLSADDRPLRQAAAEALAAIGPELLAPLRRLLRHEDVRQREGAARTLGLMGPAARGAVGTLTELLTDASAAVRVQAALALWRIDSRAADSLRVLVLVLKEVDNPGRDEAIEAVGVLAVEARPAIRGITEVLVNALKDRDLRVRLEAARWLHRRTRQGTMVLPLLRDGLADRDTAARLIVVETLGELDSEARPLPLLAAALADRDATVRQAAVEGLARLAARQPEALTALLTGKEPRLRLAAAQALALAARPAGETLLSLVGDADAAVRAAAEEGLYRCLPDDAATVRALIDTARELARPEVAGRKALEQRRADLKRKVLGPR